MYNVYVLIDPQNQGIFYVGITVDPKTRLMAAIAEARRKHDGKRRIVCSRIEDILNDGHRPLMHVIDGDADCHSAYQKEKLWIVRLNRSGVELFNEDGVSGRQFKIAT